MIEVVCLARRFALLFTKRDTVDGIADVGTCCPESYQVNGSMPNLDRGSYIGQIEESEKGGTLRKADQ